jgi:hypothetical protein
MQYAEPVTETGSALTPTPPVLPPCLFSLTFAVHSHRTAGRFVLAHLTRPSTSNYSTLLCVAVSIDEDAAGLYYRYAFDLGSQSLLTSLNLATWPSSNSYILTADTRAATTAMLKSDLNFKLHTQAFTGQEQYSGNSDAGGKGASESVGRQGARDAEQQGNSRH